MKKTSSLLMICALVSAAYGVDGGNCGAAAMLDGGTSAETRCSSTCKATWDGANWTITDDCDSGRCFCDVPPVTISSTPGAEAEFGCEEAGQNATAEKFFLTLCGEGTGIHRLHFDKSDVEMFKSFNVKVQQNSKTVWHVVAKWEPTNYKAIPTSTGSLDGSKSASALLKCDCEKLGDVALTVTYDAKDKFKYEFGAWKVEIEYFGK